MEDLATRLLESASAVAALGASQAEIDLLDDASVLAGLGLVREHERQVEAYKLWLAIAVTRRSSYELGYSGLARRNGAATPGLLIQSISGSSTAEANRLVQLGSMTIEVEDAAARPTLESGSGSSPSPAPDSGDEDADEDAGPAITAQAPWQRPIVDAVNAGRLSLDAADAIRRGLGVVDSAVTAQQLHAAAEVLVEEATASRPGQQLPPEKLWQRARHSRNVLDEEAIARGEKQRADQRYVRRFRRDGMCGGSWYLPEEEGGLEIDQAFSLMLAHRTGGPRFGYTAADARGDNATGGRETATDAARAASAPDAAEAHDIDGKVDAGVALIDGRTNEQVLADGFLQLMRGGLDADPMAVPGKRRVAVRVMITEPTLRARAGHAIVEGSGNQVSFPTIERHLCESGTLGLMFDSDGQVVNVGREARLFTTRQRDALAARDGGCRVPGCEKPPSWTEAHHIDYWARDHGKTDLADGILLCRYHHMLIHNNNWQILRRDGTYWLRPSASIDPLRRLTEMVSKNPLVAALRPTG